MRPKLTALLAVSAIALAGCSAAEAPMEPASKSTLDPAAEALKGAPPGTVYDSVTGETMSVEDYEARQEQPTSTPIDTVDALEEQFADFAELRAQMHSAKKPNRKAVIDGLHDFCATGELFSISASEDLNSNLGEVAESAYCDALGG